VARLSPTAPPCWHSVTSCWTYLVLPGHHDFDWLSLGGRNLAAAYLLPRTEYCRAAPGAPAEQVQRLAGAARRAREGQSSSILERLARALTARELAAGQNKLAG
jgi:hypothetical protein